MDMGLEGGVEVWGGDEIEGLGDGDGLRRRGRMMVRLRYYYKEG